MAFTDYIKIGFKKPNLSPDEIEKENKKNRLEESFEKIYSRLESIEILNSNEKFEDSSILSGSLALDTINLSLDFFGKPKAKTGADWKSEISKLGNDKLTSIYESYPNVLNLSASVSLKEEDLEKLETELSNLISELNSHFKQIKKSDLYTTLTQYKNRILVQTVAVVLILMATVGSYTYQKITRPDMKQTDIQVYFLSEKNPSPVDEALATAPIDLTKKGEWVVYKFPTSANQELNGIRIDPIQQKKMRYSVDTLRVLNSKGSVLFERDFRLDETLLPKDKDKFGQISDMKTGGKAKAGSPIEMESTGNDPYFIVYFSKVKDASSVELKMRHLEAHKKFTN
ncbi:hypothetical protein [Leptospira ilyithenensis]|uniref:Uncharacterized protein n=1 Tax=Leptospira ilyithenensis TaxID=2484901 RepID=A0A4R9LU50_9LEPT|nr:hypothetical protein [Leptospira ilyithenensis]TGN11637.1 hypothetical protein EHS11_05930 [Leptospira ilyithenensis]